MTPYAVQRAPEQVTIRTGYRAVFRSSGNERCILGDGLCNEQMVEGVAMVHW